MYTPCVHTVLSLSLIHIWQVAQNPETGRIDHPGCYEQSLTVLGNIRGILAEAGFVPERVAKMTVFLTDMGQKDAFDRAFERVFRRVPEKGDVYKRQDLEHRHPPFPPQGLQPLEHPRPRRAAQMCIRDSPRRG